MDREQTATPDTHALAVIHYNQLVMDAHAKALDVLGKLLDKADSDDQRRQIASVILRVKPLARLSSHRPLTLTPREPAPQQPAAAPGTPPRCVPLVPEPRGDESAGSPCLLPEHASPAAHLIFASRAAPPLGAAKPRPRSRAG